MPMVTIELGHIGTPPLGDDDLKGQVFYLPPPHDAIVVADHPVVGGWSCNRILYGQMGNYDRETVLTGVGLARAKPSLDLDPAETTPTWLALWLLRILQVRSDRDADAGRIMVLHALVPPRTICLDSEHRLRVFNAGHITNFGLPRIVARLATHGFLVARDEQPDHYTMTMPGLEIA